MTTGTRGSADSISARRKEQGGEGERRFRDWLDRCVLPHMYVEQSRLTVPKALRGEIKRPDFLVGVPTIAGGVWSLGGSTLPP